MKSINAQSTSGTEGVLIAVFTWWLRKSGVPDRLELLAEEAGVEAFYSFQDSEVGAVLLRRCGGWEAFRKDVVSDPTASDIGGTVNIWTHEAAFTRMVSNDLGARLKASDWWQRNVKAIEAHKKRVKAVKQVMES